MQPTRITINGETKTVSEWCALHGVKPVTARGRMARGWPPEQAFELEATPKEIARRALAEEKSRREQARRDAKLLVFGGIRATLRQHCARLHVPYHRAYTRLRAGHPIEFALSDRKQPREETLEEMLASM